MHLLALLQDNRHKVLVANRGRDNTTEAGTETAADDATTEELSKVTTAEEETEVEVLGAAANETADATFGTANKLADSVAAANDSLGSSNNLLRTANDNTALTSSEQGTGAATKDLAALGLPPLRSTASLGLALGKLVGALLSTASELTAVDCVEALVVLDIA